MKKSCLFATEADLVGAFCSIIQRRNSKPCLAQKWTIYHETAGWDLLLVEDGSGVQIGIEAKLRLNAKVLDQAVAAWSEKSGPDYRAVLVPIGATQLHLSSIAERLGIRILEIYDAHHRSYNDREPDWNLTGDLPDENSTWEYRAWPNWLPTQRCPLPDYVPDVIGGKASPVALTAWKIKAIKLMILLERRGVVHRSDMKALQISPSRWTDHYNGFLMPTPGGYVRCSRTPDLKAQHPRNWTEIEADFAKWNPYRLEEEAR